MVLQAIGDRGDLVQMAQGVDAAHQQAPTRGGLVLHRQQGIGQCGLILVFDALMHAVQAPAEDAVWRSHPLTDAWGHMAPRQHRARAAKAHLSTLDGVDSVDKDAKEPAALTVGQKMSADELVDLHQPRTAFTKHASKRAR